MIMAVCPEILGFLLERIFLNGQMFNVLFLKGTVFKVKQVQIQGFVLPNAKGYGIGCVF